MSKSWTRVMPVCVWSKFKFVTTDRRIDQTGKAVMMRRKGKVSLARLVNVQHPEDHVRQANGWALVETDTGKGVNGPNGCKAAAPLFCTKQRVRKKKCPRRTKRCAASREKSVIRRRREVGCNFMPMTSWSRYQEKHDRNTILFGFYRM